MTWRIPFVVLSFLLSVFIVAGCSETVSPTPDVAKGEVSNTDLAGGQALPPQSESEEVLPAYQTASEVEEAGKADRLDLRGSYESVYGATTPPSAGVRAVAEWESADAVLIAWDDQVGTFIVDMIAAIHTSAVVYVVTPSLDYSQSLQSHFSQVGLDTSRIRYFEFPHESFWTRDFGPITVELADGRAGFVDMSYYYNRRRDDAIPTLMGDYFNVPVYRPSLASEGGNFMANGEGFCAVTEWMREENGGYSSSTLADEMKRFFGCEQTMVVERMHGEGTGHIDMFAKFTQPDTVLVGYYDPQVDPNNAGILDRNAQRFAESGFRVVRIPMPTPQGNVYGSFTNSIFVNNTVFMPTYDSASYLESAATQAYLDALPAGWQVVSIDASYVIEMGGAVHCTAMAFNVGSISSGTVTVPEQPSTEGGRFGVNPGAAIRDRQVTTSVIVVPDDARGSTGAVEIDLSIEHSYVGDLYIILEHDGKTGVVYDGNGPGKDLFRSFSTDFFQGTDKAGEWTLTIQDRADQDEGRLVGWSIKL